jgi:hypothetical protein
MCCAIHHVIYACEPSCIDLHWSSLARVRRGLVVRLHCTARCMNQSIDPLSIPHGSPPLHATCRPCTTVVPCDSGSCPSGYCDCGDGKKTSPVNCHPGSHQPFKCSDVCKTSPNNGPSVVALRCVLCRGLRLHTCLPVRLSACTCRRKSHSGVRDATIYAHIHPCMCACPPARARGCTCVRLSVGAGVDVAVGSGQGGNGGLRHCQHAVSACVRADSVVDDRYLGPTLGRQHPPPPHPHPTPHTPHTSPAHAATDSCRCRWTLPAERSSP